MTNGFAVLAILVSGTALICFALMTRSERQRNKGRTPDGGGADGGADSSGHLWDWFASAHSGSDGSGHSGGGDGSGGGDSSGGGDGGGDGGGGGGD